MQTEEIQSKTLPATSGNKLEGLDTDSHFVFITDDSGIDSAFELIKSKLRSELDNCLTLIYSIAGDTSHHLFKAEIETIEKRFPAQLISHYVSGSEPVPGNNAGINQQILEIVINSNVRKSMQFQVFGEAQLVESVIDRLHFLGIHPTQINSQII